MEITALDLLIKAAYLIPYIPIYFLGVWVRLNKENKTRPARSKLKLNRYLLGDSVAGLFEALGSIIVIFGLAFGAATTTSATSDGEAWRLLAILLSSAYLTFRYGYGYPEALFGVASSPPTTPGNPPSATQ